MRFFFTADEHHGHENIIKMCNRPFANTREMTDAIIERHNKKVPNDKNQVTVHVGDMFWRTLSPNDCVSIMRRLHGTHWYVLGNHEEALERDLFARVADIETIKWDKKRIVLCHYAMRVWNKSHVGSWMLYGHSHNELPEVGLSFDVGVDGHNFEPWTLDEVAAKMATKSQHHVILPEKLVAGTEAHKIFTEGECQQ